MDLVFVHGSCVDDGAWWWSRVAALLPFPSIAAPLPSCGAAAGQAGLADDVAAVRHVLSGTGPAIVVAHSYGGVVATEAAARTCGSSSTSRRSCRRSGSPWRPSPVASRPR